MADEQPEAPIFNSKEQELRQATIELEVKRVELEELRKGMP